MKAKHDYRFFERWARHNGMAPVTRITDAKVNGRPVGDILIADSGETISVIEFPPMEGMEHSLPFVYRTGFAIDRPGEKTWFAAYNDYAPGAFLEYGSPEARLRKRCEEALQFATQALEQTHKAGLYAGPNGSPQVG